MPSSNISANNIKYKNEIEFYKNSRIRAGTLAEDAYVNLGDKKIKIKAGETIYFFDDDLFAAGTLAENTMISGIKFRANTWLSFYHDRKVYQGTLAKHTNIEGKLFKAGTEIELDKKGNVVTRKNNMHYQSGD